MKTLSFLIVLCFSSISLFSQTGKFKNKPIKNLSKSKITKNQASKKTLSNVPIFSIKEVERSASQSKNAPKDNTNALPVAIAPNLEVSPVAANVNGVISAQKPFLNRFAGITVFNADVRPFNNLIYCQCNMRRNDIHDISAIELSLRTEAGKRYLVEIDAYAPSGPIVDDVHIKVEGSGLAYDVKLPKQKNNPFSVVVQSEETGYSSLKLRCLNPNSDRRSWYVRSIEITQID